LLSGDRVLAECHEEMRKGQAERLMPMIAALLAQAGRAPADLTAIGVGIGPGNFTGIRLAVAAARGLALALGMPAVGVSRLEALAVAAPWPLLVCLDGPRGTVYLQRFDTDKATAPQRVPEDTLPAWAAPDLTVTGDAAEARAARLGAAVLPQRLPVAVAIARIAAERYGTPGLPRPAPLYLSPPDAAPARDAGPAILP
jgi:tRNA threonylcarbamoyl adenosine modification protein YeaZ